MSRIKEIGFLTYAGHQIALLSAVEFASLEWSVQLLADYESILRTHHRFSGGHFAYSDID
jgi:hypothetical protein